MHRGRPGRRRTPRTPGSRCGCRATASRSPPPGDCWRRSRPAGSSRGWWRRGGDVQRGRPWRLPLEDRVLLVATYACSTRARARRWTAFSASWRTNLTLRQVAPLFGVSKSAVDRILDHLAPLLAISPARRPRKDTVYIVDGTLVPTRDRSVAASSKNYRYAWRTATRSAQRTARSTSDHPLRSPHPYPANAPTAPPVTGQPQAHPDRRAPSDGLPPSAWTSRGRPWCLPLEDRVLLVATSSSSSTAAAAAPSPASKRSPTSPASSN